MFATLRKNKKASEPLPYSHLTELQVMSAGDFYSVGMPRLAKKAFPKSKRAMRKAAILNDARNQISRWFENRLPEGKSVRFNDENGFITIQAPTGESYSTMKEDVAESILKDASTFFSGGTFQRVLQNLAQPKEVLTLTAHPRKTGYYIITTQRAGTTTVDAGRTGTFTEMWHKFNSISLDQ